MKDNCLLFTLWMMRTIQVLCSLCCNRIFGFFSHIVFLKYLFIFSIYLAYFSCIFILFLFFVFLVLQYWFSSIVHQIKKELKNVYKFQILTNLSSSDVVSISKILVVVFFFSFFASIDNSILGHSY